MNWKTTWFLVLLAVAMLIYIVAFERPRSGASDGGLMSEKIVPLQVSAASTIQVRRTNQLVVRVERTNDSWNITVPIAYPAQSFAIARLLAELEALAGPPILTGREMTDQKRTLAEFGLEVPAATLTLQAGGQRAELNFGNKTSVGDQVYLQVQNVPGIYLVRAGLFDRLPETASDWRNLALIDFGGIKPDRFEVRAAGRGFAIGVDPTNQAFHLTKPTPARADRAKVEALLRKVESARVARFVSDDPRADLEPYGLQPPEAELVFGVGTNDALVIQFGKSPTNDASLVYARRMSQTNIVLVDKAVLDALLTPYTGLRERRLLTVDPAQIASIELVGPESFAVSRQTNGQWTIGEPPVMTADAGLVADWLTLLGKMEGDVERDFVTDFAAYGLAKPAWRYILRSSVTNAAGQVTNQIVGQLEFGNRVDTRLFVRRSDEQSVYTVSLDDFHQLPTAAWQLRDRRVWSFTTNQVQRITIRQRGYTRTLERNTQGRWTLAAGSQGAIRGSEAIEELMYRLGELRAVWWTDRGKIDRAKYGFSDGGYQLTIELAGGDKTSTVQVEFGGWAPSKFPYALTTLDGQPVVFEFPLQLFWLLQRDLANPPREKAAAGQS